MGGRGVCDNSNPPHAVLFFHLPIFYPLAKHRSAHAAPGAAVVIFFFFFFLKFALARLTLSHVADFNERRGVCRGIGNKIRYFRRVNPVADRKASILSF